VRTKQIIGNLAIVGLLCGCAAPIRGTTEALVVRKMSDVLPVEENRRELFLWRHFANKPEEQQFNSQTARGWRQKYAGFAATLVKKAAQQRYDSTSLSSVLKAIQGDPDLGSVALLPVGAYVTTLDGEPVWIVVLKWEVPSSPRDLLAHIRVYAFTQREIKKVGFVTCG
jgi:hypothetical protein